MRRSGVGSGGGLGMSKVTHRQAPKTEPKPYAKRPAGVSQLGYSVGDHVTNRAGSTGYKGEAMNRGPGYRPPGMISDPVKAVGVGGGRTIYKTGYQDQHGPAAAGNPQPAGKDILRQFGPESTRS